MNKKHNNSSSANFKFSNRGGFPSAGKANNFKKAIADLFRYSKKHVRIIIIAIVLSSMSAILSLVSPNKIGDFTNLIAEGMFSPMGMDIAGITKLAVLLLGIYIVSASFTYLQGFLMAGVTQKISKNMRKDISLKINQLPLSYIDSNSYGDVLSRVTNDVDTIAQNLNNSSSNLISNLILLLGCIIMMFVTNWILALSVIVSSFVGFFVMSFIMSKSQKYFIGVQAELGKLNGQIEEGYSGQQVVRVYNATNEYINKFNKQNKKLYDNAWKSQFMSGLMGPLMGFVGNLGYVVVCVVGAVLCANGKTDIGVIVSFIVYARMFSNPLSTLAQCATALQSTAASSERVFDILSSPEMPIEEQLDKIENGNVKGNVQFSNVCFGYEKDKLVINNFSASISAGQKVAIVGPTGAGKTTLVNLLMKFYSIDSGQISIDGIDISRLSRENIHNIFGMVLQDTWLFEGTIKDNIAYNMNNIDKQKIKDICKTVGVHHFIKTLPDGYDTILNENTSISSGQKQLLTIARAMLQNSPMLILDEATSSVDTRTEILIQNAMDKLVEGRTSFVIAHRLSTIKNADLILVMDNGNIVEQGTHNQLLANNGFYADLYNSQFEINE